VEPTVLAALFASALVAGVVLVALRGPAPPPVIRALSHRDRLRLPARTFERAVVVAVVAGACAVAAAFADDEAGAADPSGSTTGGVVVAAAVLWCARRGVFLSLRADKDDAHDAPRTP
jgi:hypothetical protein